MYTFLFDKKSLVLLLTGITVAGGLLFSGGILVGVQWGLPLGSYTAPTPVVRKAALPAERPCKPEPEAAPSPVAPEPAAPEFEEPEPEPQMFAAAASPPRETAPVLEEPRPEPEVAPVPAAPPVLPEPEPAVFTASQSPGRYSLQIGAFRQAKNSEKVIQTLQSKGYEPYVIEERGRSVLKTVRVGRFADRGEALKAASDFRRREGMEAIVRPLARPHPNPSPKGEGL